jgi:hypothetical protein
MACPCIHAMILYTCAVSSGINQAHTWGQYVYGSLQPVCAHTCLCSTAVPGSGPESDSKAGLLALIMLRMIPYKGHISFQVGEITHWLWRVVNSKQHNSRAGLVKPVEQSQYM